MTDEHRSQRSTSAAADDVSGPVRYDARGRLPAGSLPGWGMSWWLDEHDLLAAWEQLSTTARLEHMNDYWRAVSEGWWPSATRDQWVGPFHPWKPGG